MAGSVLAASTARAPGTYDADAEMVTGDELVVEIDVNAVSPTPSLAVEILWSSDGGSEYVAADPADTMTAITAVGGKTKKFSKKGDHFRVRQVVTGSGTITYEVRVDFE